MKGTLEKELTPEKITKGSTLIATLKSEFPMDCGDDLMKELHEMMWEFAKKYNKILNEGRDG